MSEIEHNHINEKINKLEQDLCKQGAKIEKLELVAASTPIQIEYLSIQIAELSNTIKWSMTTVIVMLSGFVIWYIQNLSK